MLTFWNDSTMYSHTKYPIPHGDEPTRGVGCHWISADVRGHLLGSHEYLLLRGI